MPFKAQESQQIDDFVSKIDEDVDVIWGITYDDTLGDKVKFTILAAGFDVTVREGKTAADTIQISGPAAKGDDDPINIDRIRDFYGDEKVDEMQRQRDVMNYMLLEPDQLDNDEAIDAFEKAPAFNRKKKSSASPVTRQPQDAAKKSDAPANEPSAGTIEIEFSDDDF